MSKDTHHLGSAYQVADDNHQPRTKRSSRFDIYEDIESSTSNLSLSSIDSKITPTAAATILSQPKSPHLRNKRGDSQLSLSIFKKKFGEQNYEEHSSLNISSELNKHQSEKHIQRKKKKSLQDQVHAKLSYHSISPGQLYATESGRLFHAGKILIVLAGLPARSKTKLGVALTRYLRWLGVKTQSFHTSDYRMNEGCIVDEDDYVVDPEDGKTYFNMDSLSADTEYALDRDTDEKKKQGILKRRNFIDKCLSDIDDFFFDDQNNSQIAIYDALNVTVEERDMLNKRYSQGEKGHTKGCSVLFIESIVTDDELLQRNINAAVNSMDYAGWDHQKALDHFMQRIERNKKVYVEMGGEKENHLSFVKYIDYGETLYVNNSNHSYLINKIISFLMNLKEKKGRVYLSRCGNSDYDKYSEDEILNEEGLKFAKKMTDVVITRINTLRKSSDLSSMIPVSPMTTEFSMDDLKTQVSVNRNMNLGKVNKRQISKHDGSDEDSVVVFSAPRKRTYDTAQFFLKKGITVRKKLQLKQLNPGVIVDKTLEEVKEQHPVEFEEFLENPYFYRFTKGESYHDLALRMGSLIFEVERMNGDVLIIAHESALRIIYGYLMAKSAKDIPTLEFDRETVIEISFGHYENKAVKLPVF